MSAMMLRDRLARYSMPERAEALDPDAKLSQHQRQSDELIALAWERHHRAPGDLQLVDWLAYLLYANGRHGEAIPLLERLVQGSAPTALQHFHLANCFHATGEADRAVDHWELVVRTFPGSDVARKALARLRVLYLNLRKNPALPARTA